MNPALANLILLAIMSPVTWELQQFDQFCNRIDPLIFDEYISQDELDAIMEEFDLHESGTEQFCCKECCSLQCSRQI